MISSKSLNFFLFFTLIFCSSCKYFQNSANSNTSSNQTNISEFETDEIYSTKEPETFQAEIVEKTEDGEIEKTFIAKSGQRFLVKKDQIGTLKIDANKSYAINFSKKIYVENEEKFGEIKETKDATEETLQQFLTNEWLNQKSDAKIEDVGTENGLRKFQAKFESSEVLIFVDETLKLPIRQEFYSLDGEQKSLTYSFEIQGFKLLVDETNFEIPKDFRKVSAEEFHKHLHENE
jgi:paraquat-inducible protein B